MQFFNLLSPGSPVAVSSVLGLVPRDTGRSSTLFLVMVCVAGAVWLLAMVALAGGWKKVLALLSERSTIASVAGIAILFTVVLAAIVYRGAVLRGGGGRSAVGQGAIARESSQTRVGDRRPVRLADDKVRGTKVQSPVRERPREREKAVVATVPPPKSSRPKRRVENPAVHEVKRPAPSAASTAPLKVAKVVHPSAPGPAPAVEKPTIVVRRASVLSEVQTKQICGAVGGFAGAQVYIKWSPGVNAEQFARQLSKGLDCARVTVTYASVSGSLGGRGIRVGTHADEGVTSERLRPFADAIAAALREQGFTVSQVSGSNIPSDQTAILIGPD